MKIEQVPELGENSKYIVEQLPKRAGDEFEPLETEQPQKYFFIFKDHEQQEKAMRLLEDRRQYYDELRQVKNFNTDPSRPDVGVRVDFARDYEQNKQKIGQLFSKLGLEVVEDVYSWSGPDAPDAEMPVPQGSPRSNVISMPNRRKSGTEGIQKVA